MGHTSNITQTTVVHEETNLQEGHLQPKIKWFYWNKMISRKVHVKPLRLLKSVSHE